MLPKPKEKIKAMALRKQGLSYSEILQHVPVAQATLSLWLRDVPLTAAQKARLKNLSQGAGARARHNMRLTKQEALENEVEEEIKSLLKQPFFLLGLALYWGEGDKPKPWNIDVEVRFSNSDEKAILMMRKWLSKYGGIAPTDFGYTIHIHITANIEQAKEQWAKVLQVNKEEFRVNLKRNIVKSRHKNENYKGLIQMRARKSTWLNRRIELWTKAVTQEFLA